MFEPNSIRSLLTKRNSSRAQSASSSASQQQQNKSNLDPDYDTIIQIKMITKQIEHKIQSIRQWREHQKQLMQQKLKSNAELAHELNSVHFKHLEKEAQREQQELKKILQQLKNSQATQIRIKENEEIYDSQRIFNVLTETDNLREKLKNSSFAQSQPSSTKQENYIGLVSELDQINSIFSKKQTPNESQPKQGKEEKIDSSLLQKEMDEIEKQLREIEELLANEDDDQSKKKQKGKQKGNKGSK